MISRMKCFIFGHSWSVIVNTWLPTGKKAVSWSARIVPEYKCMERCDTCGKIKASQYISLAD